MGDWKEKKSRNSENYDKKIAGRRRTAVNRQRSSVLALSTRSTPCRSHTPLRYVWMSKVLLSEKGRCFSCMTVVGSFVAWSYYSTLLLIILYLSVVEILRAVS